jgi:cytochrome c5
MKSVSSKFALSVAAAIVLATVLNGCGKSHHKPTFEYMPHMADSFAVKAQHLGPFGEGMRVPPSGTLSQTSVVAYAYATDPEGAGKALKNPLPRTMAVMNRGQKTFNTFCIVCHGPKAEGNGYVVPRFPQPPSLHSEKVRGWTDGRIFHVITMGQNLMPGYALQISPEDRWAVIHYVRALQRAVNPTKADLEELERQKAGNKL